MRSKIQNPKPKIFTWSLLERRAWQLPAAISISDWAEKNLVLTTIESNIPGKLNLDITPYLRAIMNLCGDPNVEEIVLQKAVQIGGSLAMRSVLAYWIDQDPGPVLFILPDEKAAVNALTERVAPMIRSTPALAQYITTTKRDITDYHVKLTNSIIRNGWAGSPQSLASEPYRRCVFDETDKYPPFSGQDSAPIPLGEKRTTTFGDRRKLIKLSTPTTQHGNISKAFVGCPIKLRYFVPCPECGARQMLTFSHIRWEKGEEKDSDKRADRIKADQSAWYECLHCKARLEDRHKPLMILRGIWADEGETFPIDECRMPNAEDKNGIVWPREESGARIRSRRVGFQLPGLYSPWVTFSEIAAAFLKSKGAATTIMDWRNNYLAEVFEETATLVGTGQLMERIKAGHARGVCPDWVSLIIATADTQKDFFKVVIRAWGAGSRSRLLAYGRVETFEDLKRVCLESTFGFEDTELPRLRARMLLIDAGGGAAGETEEGTRTFQVYKFAAKDSARILALHGHGGRRPMAMPFQIRKAKYTPPGTNIKIDQVYLRVNTDYYKNVLADRIAGPVDAPDAWELHKDVALDYQVELASEHKVLVGKKERRFEWHKIAAGATNDYWDAEVYQTAAADMLQVENLPAVVALIKEQKQREAAHRDDRELTMPDGRPFLISDR